MEKKIISFLETVAQESNFAFHQTATELLEEMFEKEIREVFCCFHFEKEMREVIKKKDKIEFAHYCRYLPDDSRDFINENWNKLDKIMEIVGGLLNE